MNPLTHDARGFVEGVVSYLRREGKAEQYVPRVRKLLQKVTASTRRQQEARVRSVVALTASEKQALGRVLASVIGRPVTIRCTVDRSLLGGLRVDIGDLIIDTTLSRQLNHFVEQSVVQ